MKVYLDMCAWKRPFDDQTQGRILIETTAVIRILDAADAGLLTLCNSAALEAQNQRNTNRQRRERVGVLLATTGRAVPASTEILSRAEHLAQRGFGDLDALSFDKYAQTRVLIWIWIGRKWLYIPKDIVLLIARMLK